MLDRAARPPRLGARVALVAGFGGILVLMAVAGINSIGVLHQIEAGNTRITQTYLARHHTLDRIRSSLYLSGSYLRDYLLDSSPRAAQAHVRELARLREVMNADIEKYASAQSAAESSLVSALRAEVAEYWQVLLPVFRWDASERRDKGQAFLQANVLPRRSATLNIADRIEAINEGALREGDRRSAELFRSFRRRVIVILVVTLALGFGLAGLTIAYILRLEKEARLRYQEIVQARGELRKLSARLVQAQEEERRAISRELHDEIGQSLSALLVDLGNLVAITPPENEQAWNLVATMRRIAEQTLSEVRNMALLLRPSMLDDFGLVPALRWHAREVSRRTGLFVDVEAEEAADELPEEYKTCVYRVAQEALHNASRHSGARTVKISVTQETERLLLTVQDDGKGFDAPHARGLGLTGIEERVRHLGGFFHIDSKPGQGTLLKVNLPLASRSMAIPEKTA